MRSSEFMSAMPEAVNRCLATSMQLRRGRLWSFGVQLYDDNPLFHYEVARVPVRLGDRLEIGFHFESKNAADNHRMLDAFAARMIEIKAELGADVEAELWDKGWTKIYETLPLETYSPAYLQVVARQLARMITVLHPVYLANRR